MPTRLVGFIDKKGKMVIQPQFSQAGPFREGVAKVSLGKDQWGYIDKNGKLIIEAKYKQAWDFNDGLAMVQLNKGFGYIDKSGNNIAEKP